LKASPHHLTPIITFKKKTKGGRRKRKKKDKTWGNATRRQPLLLPHVFSEYLGAFKKREGGRGKREGKRKEEKGESIESQRVPDSSEFKLPRSPKKKKGGGKKKRKKGGKKKERTECGRTAFDPYRSRGLLS